MCTWSAEPSIWMSWGCCWRVEKRWRPPRLLTRVAVPIGCGTARIRARNNLKMLLHLFKVPDCFTIVKLSFRLLKGSSFENQRHVEIDTWSGSCLLNDSRIFATNFDDGVGVVVVVVGDDSCWWDCGDWLSLNSGVEGNGDGSLFSVVGHLSLESVDRVWNMMTLCIVNRSKLG